MTSALDRGLCLPKRVCHLDSEPKAEWRDLFKVDSSAQPAPNEAEGSQLA